MRPILVLCALHASSHALQAPRPQCTTSLQTPRPHRVTSLRASPPAETEEAPTAQWLASLALAGAALGPVPSRRPFFSFREATIDATR